MTIEDAVILITALALLALTAALSLGDGGQQYAQPDDASQEEYAREMKEWDDQLCQQEELRREVLMNEFAQYVWAVSGVGETAESERDGTKVLSVAPDTDVLRIATSYGLVFKASFVWGRRRTRIIAEAEFFGMRADGGGGYVIHEAARFRGGRLSLPLGKVAKWAASVAGAAASAIASIGEAASVAEGPGGGSPEGEPDGAAGEPGCSGEYNSVKGGKGK